jgi:hypothetical protein
MSLSLTFRTLAVAALAAGLALGISFGVGVAYGRGDPKTVQSGLTAQQIQQLYGGGGAGGAGAAGAAGGAQGNAGGGAAGNAAALGARSTMGRVTAVNGQTVTIETRQGSQKIQLTSGSTVNKLTTGSSGDIQEGSTIVASGTRKDDGSFDATSVSQVPPEVAALLGGGAGGTGGTGTTSPAATPSGR